MLNAFGEHPVTLLLVLGGFSVVFIRLAGKGRFGFLLAMLAVFIGADWMGDVGLWVAATASALALSTAGINPLRRPSTKAPEPDSVVSTAKRAAVTGNHTAASGPQRGFLPGGVFRSGIAKPSAPDKRHAGVAHAVKTYAPCGRSGPRRARRDVSFRAPRPSRAVPRH